MEEFASEIVPGFHSVRDNGLNMVDASESAKTMGA